MATDATGTPTPLGIPKFNTSADAPSGLGSNAQMDSIDTLIAARVEKPSGLVSGEVPVWNGSAWVRSSVTNIGSTSLGSGTPDSTKFLRGDGAWSTVAQVLMGSTLRKVNAGTCQVTFSASSTSANPGPDVAHGLGVVPIVVLLTPQDVDIVPMVQSGGMTSTNFKPVAMTNGGGSVSATYTLQWIAVG